VTLVKPDVSEERIAPIVFLLSVHKLIVTAIVVPSSLILFSLMMKAIRFSETSVFKEPHCFTSQKTEFLVVTAVKNSNLT
jgi:hypothetical protein